MNPSASAAGRAIGRPIAGCSCQRRQRSGLDPVEVETSVEMVDLVLDETGRPPREDLVDWLTMLVEGLDPDGVVSGHDPGEPWNAQAPFVEAHQVVTMHRLQCRIDQDCEGQRVPCPCRSIFLAQLSPSLRAVLKYGELERHSDLGGGQTDPWCCVHGRPHQDDKTLQLGRPRSAGSTGSARWRRTGSPHSTIGSSSGSLIGPRHARRRQHPGAVEPHRVVATTS